MKRVLVVHVNFCMCSLFEVARGTNCLLTWEGDHKPGGLVPVVVPDGVWVFGVGKVIFAGEDLRLLLEPTSLQSQDLGVLGRELQFGGCAAIQREDILHVVPRSRKFFVGGLLTKISYIGEATRSFWFMGFIPRICSMVRVKLTCV